MKLHLWVSTEFQLNLELHLPSVTVKGYFAYSQGDPPEYDAITEAFLAIFILIKTLGYAYTPPHNLMGSWFRYARCHDRNPPSTLKSALCMS